MGSARRAIVTSVGLMLVRRRLQRKSGPMAAVALFGLELFGARILKLRRLLALTLALTIVGAVVVAAIWWWRRGAGARVAAAPEPPAEPVTVDAPISPDPDVESV